MSAKFWIAPIAVIMILQGCTTATIFGFIKGSREDRIQREYADGYEGEVPRREAGAMREEMEELDDAQRDMCISNGGTVIGSRCHAQYDSQFSGRYGSPYKARYTSMY